MASWYLKYIIVHDLQTREKFFFLCESWLAVEKGLGTIDRTLPLACDVQKFDLKYFTMKHTKESMADTHLWYSIFTRPMKSTFTRCDRVTCAFVLLYITMMFNILYFGVETQTISRYIFFQFGPVELTPELVRFLISFQRI